jgi:K+ transporter
MLVAVETGHPRFVGKEKIVTWGSSSFLLGLFILVHRTMLGATEFYKIQPSHVVELGGHIEI